MSSSYCADALVVSPQRIDCGYWGKASWSARVAYDSESHNQISIEPLKNRIFDLASLTKPIATSTLLVDLAIKEGACSLEKWAKTRFVKTEIPEVEGTVLSELNIWELWHHKSGLNANIELKPLRPFFFKVEDRGQAQTEVLKHIVASHSSALRKNETLYSDLGFLLLGIFLERVGARNLHSLWDEWCVRYSGPDQENEGCFPSFHPDHLRSLPSRMGILQTETKSNAGVVNDDKAYFLGGVAPHAGLFGNVEQVSRWVQSILDLRKKQDLYDQWITQSFGGRFAFGWDTPSGEKDSHAGESAPKTVRGHLGYTGTSLWIDPVKETYGILLTNRVHPKASEINKVSIKHLRSRFYEALWQGKLYLG